MNIAQAIIHLFPQANPMTDFIVQDDSDGNGAYIAQWNLKDAEGNDVPQPTDVDLQTAWDSMQPTDADLLTIAQLKKKQEISNAVSAKIIVGYQSTVVLASTGKAHLYGTTLIDQQNMTAYRVYATDNPTAVIKYRPQDEFSRIEHTHEEFLQISDAVYALVNGYLEQGYALYRQVFAQGVTTSEVDAIVVNITDPATTP